MNHIEKGWIESSKRVQDELKNISHAKSRRMVYRINKKAYEMALVEHKKAMNAAMRAGDYAEVSRNHKVINILRVQLHQECHAIRGKTLQIKVSAMRLVSAEERRDQFERAYRLIELADREIMNDVPVVPMQDGDMEEIVTQLGY